MFEQDQNYNHDLESGSYAKVSLVGSQAQGRGRPASIWAKRAHDRPMVSIGEPATATLQVACVLGARVS
ncbi:MAG: hypothetical protein JWM79_663 [Nocardioides sp.]|nr:hypothetical protein [Nocardioides sp.]